jgi:hypothetical protein
MRATGIAGNGVSAVTGLDLGEKGKGQSIVFSPIPVKQLRTPKSRSSGILSLLTAFRKGKLREYITGYVSNEVGQYQTPRTGVTAPT